MDLFANKPRTDQSYAKPGERSYSFLNRSGRKEFAVVREKLNAWFNHYPEEEQHELKRRLQSVKQFSAAFFELYTHEFFYSRGYQLSVHPNLEHTTKQPDFLVSKSDEAIFYLEAKVVRDQSDEKHAYEKRRQRIADEINKLENFPYWIAINKLQLKTEESFSIKSLLRKVRLHEKQLDYWTMITYRREHVLLHDDENFEIELGFYPRTVSTLDGDDPAVGIHGYFEVGFVKTHVSIARGIEEKAKRYGKPDFPLVIAINCISPHHFSTDDLELVLGKDFYRLQSNKPISGERLIHTDGIFANPSMNHVAGLFITWVTPYHQDDEQWFWCGNPNFAGKEFVELDMLCS